MAKPILSNPLIPCFSISLPEIAETDSGMSRTLSSLFLAVTVISSITLADSSATNVVNGNANKLNPEIRPKANFVIFIILPKMLLKVIKT